MEEIWKDIENYNGAYQVSNFGEVKSVERLTKSRLGNLNKLNKGRILKHCVSNNGYHGVLLCKDGKMKRFTLHRLVAQAFILNTENKPQVNHINGKKSDNHVKNLEWCTMVENMKHAVKTGLRDKTIGERATISKLTEAQVAEIRISNLNYTELGKIYGVNDRTISAVARRLTWKHI